MAFNSSLETELGKINEKDKIENNISKLLENEDIFKLFSSVIS